MSMTIPSVYLSRRNLLTLLSKLDRVAAGEQSQCQIVKCDNQHPTHSQTHSQIVVTAVEDDVYYAHREPGYVLDIDIPKE